MQEEKDCFPISVTDFLCSSVTGPLFIYDIVSNLDCISWVKVPVPLLWLFVLDLHTMAKNRGRKNTENTLDESSTKTAKIG